MGEAGSWLDASKWLGLAKCCEIHTLRRMRASLSDLARHTAKIVRPVIDGGKKVTLTVHGEARAEIIPIPNVDRKAAWAALMEIGPVDIKPRK